MLPQAILFELDDTLIQAYGGAEVARLVITHELADDLGASYAERGSRGRRLIRPKLSIVTLNRPEMAWHLTFVHEPRGVPIVMSLEEVARFLESGSREARARLTNPGAPVKFP